MAEREIVTDEGGTGPKTSIKMTRSMGEDIGWIGLDVMEKIEDETIDYNYTKWQWFFANFWGDKIWKKVMSKVVGKAKNDKFALNKNKVFLDYVFENTATELNAVYEKGMHPIARFSLMELVDKEKPEPEKPKTVEELWP